MRGRGKALNPESSVCVCVTVPTFVSWQFSHADTVINLWWRQNLVWLVSKTDGGARRIDGNTVSQSASQSNGRAQSQSVGRVSQTDGDEEIKVGEVDGAAVQMAAEPVPSQAANTLPNRAVSPAANCPAAQQAACRCQTRSAFWELGQSFNATGTLLHFGHHFFFPRCCCRTEWNFDCSRFLSCQTTVSVQIRLFLHKEMKVKSGLSNFQRKNWL